MGTGKSKVSGEVEVIRNVSGGWDGFPAHGPVIRRTTPEGQRKRTKTHASKDNQMRGYICSFGRRRADQILAGRAVRPSMLVVATVAWGACDPWRAEGAALRTMDYDVGTESASILRGAHDGVGGSPAEHPGDEGEKGDKDWRTA